MGKTVRGWGTMMAAAVLIASGAAGAGEKLKIATGDKFPPYTGKDLPSQGMTTEFTLEALRQAGYDPELSWDEWKRVEKGTLELEYDVAFPYSATKDRLPLFQFSRSIETTAIRIFVPASSTLDFDPRSGFDPLFGKAFCSPRGFAYVESLKAAVEAGKIKIVTPDDYKTCFDLMDRGRAEFLAANEVSVWKYAVDHFGAEADKKVKTLPSAVKLSVHFLMVSKKHSNGDEIIKRFNESFDRLVNKGYMAEVARRHLGRDIVDFRPTARDASF